MMNAVLIFSFYALLFFDSTSSFAQTAIRTDGSNTVFLITDAIGKEFQKNRKASVSVGISGTGGGFKKFCKGESDVQNASRPISESEMADCKKAGIKYFEFPIAYDAIVVVVSPKNLWAKDIQISELKKIWESEAQGQLLRWNQIRKLWPDTPLKLFGATSDSGTFDYFTEAILGKAKACRSDYVASEDYNTLALGISNEEYSLGYLPYAYYEKNKRILKALGILSDSNSLKNSGSVLPSRLAVKNGSYSPLARPIFIYVSSKSTERSEIKDFINFYLSRAAAIAEQVNYIPLPKKAYETALKHFHRRKLGSVFEGKSAVGLKIEDLLKREAQL